MFFEVGYFLEFKSKVKETRRNTVDMITVQLKHGILFAAVAAFAECFRQNPSISACHSTLHLHQVPTPSLAAKQKSFFQKASLRVPEAKRHCIMRRGKANTMLWSGFWLPVLPSSRWKPMAVASELEELEFGLRTCHQVQINQVICLGMLTTAKTLPCSI